MNSDNQQPAPRQSSQTHNPVISHNSQPVNPASYGTDRVAVASLVLAGLSCTIVFAPFLLPFSLTLAITAIVRAKWQMRDTRLAVIALAVNGAIALMAIVLIAFLSWGLSDWHDF